VVTKLRLCPLRLEDERAARSAHETLAAAGYTFLFDHDPDEQWETFIERDRRQVRGIDLPPDRVSAAFLLAWVNDRLVGRASVRFELNAYLAAAGGHIGYAVLPEHRRRGHATEILRQSVVIARAAGVRDVLVTCAVENTGSRTVIERCGGEFESTVHDPQEGVEKRRYWIR
jgi:predicted acetyltransferase